MKLSIQILISLILYVGLNGQDEGSNETSSSGLINQSGCGQRAELFEAEEDLEGEEEEDDGSDRIIGGSEATHGEWPWQIAMYFEGSFYCGGSLINNQWIVSAAHCVGDNLDPESYEIYMGMTDKENSESSTESRKVEGVFRHPDWNSDGLINDIVLFKLVEPVDFSENITPVCLADGELDIPYGKKTWTTGWGKTAIHGGSSQTLMEVKLPLLTPEKCIKFFSNIMPVDPDNNVCAGNPNSPQTGCNGDSGGPLVLKDPSTGNWNLIGITSWGPMPCTGGVIYTRVSSYLDWIQQTVDKN